MGDTTHNEQSTSGMEDSVMQSGKDPYDDDYLLTMYEQAGEEYRLRHRLLHNIYYLLIIAILLAVGNIPAITENQTSVGMFLIAVGPLFVLLGFVTIKHYVDRRSASSVRRVVEKVANGDHDGEIERPLGIEHYITGRNSELDENGNLTDAGSTWRAFFHTPGLSANTVALLMVGGGVLLLFVGIAVYLIL